MMEDVRDLFDLDDHFFPVAGGESLASNTGPLSPDAFEDKK
jgi:hypothetical protein